MLGDYLSDRPVLVIAHIVKRRNIDSLDTRGSFQEFFLGAFFGFAPLHKPHKLKIHLLALAYCKKIDKVRQRLCVAHARSSRHNYRRKLPPFARKHGKPRQIQHFQYGCVAHLILYRKSDKIKILDGIKAFQRVKRYPAAAHLFLHIGKRHEYALTPVVGYVVFQSVKYLHSQMGHTYLVCIGKAKGEAHVHFTLVLYNSPDLAAYITRRFSHLRQKFVQFIHHFNILIHHKAPYFKKFKISA